MDIRDEYVRRSALYGTRVRTYRDSDLALSMLMALRLGEGRKVLDLGAGQGDASSPLVRSGASVFALDLSPEMLRLGAKRGLLEPERSVVWDLRKGTLPFQAESFDIVLSRYALHDLPDPQAILCEARRVTRPGGRLQIVDMALPSRRGLRLYNAIHSRKVLSGRLRCWIREVPMLSGLIVRAGFSEPQVQWYESRLRSTDWLAEGQLDEAGHAMLVEYVGRAAEQTPHVARLLGIDMRQRSFDACFPVAILTARREV